LSLVVYTALRRQKTAVHWYLTGLLGMILAWGVAMMLRYAGLGDDASDAGAILAQLSSCALLPFFLLTIVHHGRVDVFEHSPAANFSVAVPFALFATVMLTNESHHLYQLSRESMPPGDHPLDRAGPFYWAFQAWCYGYVAWALVVIARLWAREPRAGRHRLMLIVGGIIAPVAAHSAYTARWLPLDYPLTSGALGITAVCLVLGIHRYGLFEAGPVVQRDVIQHLEDGLVLADEDGRILDANPAAERILDRSGAALRGQPLETVLDGLGLEGAVAAHRGVQTELETADGRTIQVTTDGVSPRDGQPAGRYLVLRDRTAERQGERMLRQRQKLESVGILAAGIAHEVNNPLAFVRANLVHLQQLGTLVDKHLRGGDRRAPEELEEFGEVVEESLVGLDRIGRIVDGLLRFSRAPSEREGQVDLNAMVGEALRLAALHRNQRVAVETALAENLPQVPGYADRLVQVVLNLLLNAKQSLGEDPDGRIRVETGVEGESAVVRVHDNGPGVPLDLQDRIFDPFFTTRGPGEGTGLGLSIAFDILREHGGSLALESTPGDGACFTVRLPLVA
ncbi:MAG: ATP-binding protein, partial [Proteobacteria bacterium]|nr:ATP-binding protein [Pseudomonadota bacterium]